MTRSLRCCPFLAVALCFVLPFFSASSCDAGTETTATGFEIVAGSRLVKQQVKQPLNLVESDGEPQPPPPRLPLGPVGSDAEAQAASEVARPWMAIALLAVVLGGCLAVIADRRWRGVQTVAAGVALMAWVAAAIAVDGSAPKRSREEFSLEVGFVLGLLILIATVLWGVWAMSRVHDTQGRSATAPIPTGRVDPEEP